MYLRAHSEAFPYWDSIAKLDGKYNIMLKTLTRTYSNYGFYLRIFSAFLFLGVLLTNVLLRSSIFFKPICYYCVRYKVWSRGNWKHCISSICRQHWKTIGTVHLVLYKIFLNGKEDIMLCEMLIVLFIFVNWFNKFPVCSMVEQEFLIIFTVSRTAYLFLIYLKCSHTYL